VVLLANQPVFTLGNKLEGEKLAAFKNELRKDIDINEFIQTIQKNYSVKNNLINFEDVAEIDQGVPQSEDVIIGKIAVLTKDEGHLKVFYITGEKNNEPYKFISGYAIQDSEEEELTLKSFELVDGEVIVEESKIGQQDKERMLRDKVEFKVNPDYTPGVLKENDVESLSDYPTWGCALGGYLWCGAECDNYRDEGGTGSWINGTDWCCMEHDWCFRTGWSSKCQCDLDLKSCLSNQSSATATYIGAAMPRHC
jgi:hypothetical protein